MEYLHLMDIHLKEIELLIFHNSGILNDQQMVKPNYLVPKLEQMNDFRAMLK